MAGTCAESTRASTGIHGNPKKREMGPRVAFRVDTVRARRVSPEPGLSARPLPASSHITFSFEPSAPGPFEPSVFDVQGRRLQSLQGRAEGAGRHELRWDLRDGSGRRVPTGLYLARLRRGDDVLLARVVIAQ